MYARLVYVGLSLYPRTREQVEDVLKTISCEVKGLKGMKGYTLFTDWGSGQVGSLVLWESKEAEEAAWEKLKPKLDAAKSIMFLGRPIAKLFDVYDHRASRSR